MHSKAILGFLSMKENPIPQHQGAAQIGVCCPQRTAGLCFLVLHIIYNIEYLYFVHFFEDTIG